METSTALHATITNPLMEVMAEIVSSYVLNHKMAPDELENLIEQVYVKLEQLNTKNTARSELPAGAHGAVSAEQSIQDDYLICLEDGKRLKMLKRYLKTNYNMTPEEYRDRWNLPNDYPMVAPNYAKERSKLAKQIGLGHHSSARRRKHAPVTLRAVA